MAQDLAFALFFATIVTAIAYCECRYNEAVERRRWHRLATARVRDRMRGTAEEKRLLRETRLQRAVQRSTSYVISVSVLCAGLLLVRAGLLPP